MPRRLVRNVGFDILDETATGLPLGVVVGDGGAVGLIRRVDDGLVRIRPSLFGYQYILRLTPHAEDVVRAGEADGELRSAAPA